MSAVILTHPAKAAELVCHEEQLDIWVEDIFQRLNMENALRSSLVYSDAAWIRHILRDEVRKLVRSAFLHPEALKPREVPK